MSRRIVELKVEGLKKQIRSAGWTCFPLGIVPTEETVVESYASFFVEQLGLDVKSLERRAADPKKLDNVKIKVEEVMEDIPKRPRILKRSERIRLFQRLPLVGGGISAEVVASSLKEILNRLEVITLDAIDAFNERN